MTESDSNRIRSLGHRRFVGGDGPYWDEIGMLQLQFLVAEGLKPTHTLLDVACGSLRAGRFFIDYLDAGNYLGVDKEIDLIIHGVAQEIGIQTFVQKRPLFVVSGGFDFGQFSRRPDYAIAQSLFTHLTADDIRLCLHSLRSFLADGGRFYATFFEVQSPVSNRQASDSIECFFYTRDQIGVLAQSTGWRMQYIGNWGHPRKQVMVKLEPD